jgi:hypothetical protein
MTCNHSRWSPALTSSPGGGGGGAAGEKSSAAAADPVTASLWQRMYTACWGAHAATEAWSRTQVVSATVSPAQGEVAGENNPDDSSRSDGAYGTGGASLGGDSRNAPPPSHAVAGECAASTALSPDTGSDATTSGDRREGDARINIHSEPRTHGATCNSRPGHGARGRQYSLRPDAVAPTSVAWSASVTCKSRPGGADVLPLHAITYTTAEPARKRASCASRINLVSQGMRDAAAAHTASASTIFSRSIACEAKKRLQNNLANGKRGEHMGCRYVLMVYGGVR